MALKPKQQQQDKIGEISTKSIVNVAHSTIVTVKQWILTCKQALNSEHKDFFGKTNDLYTITRLSDKKWTVYRWNKYIKSSSRPNNNNCGDVFEKVRPRILVSMLIDTTPTPSSPSNSKD
ncbi:hypothetical protein CHS0354_027470 [Potamilus streckersoni]|uniref:Uncharacterized protein n=1 Tax=Potamilus streckersoni TaxID=2493646 RepID=A0AAE0T6M1_9BIVA|nr:hypothetical protein CHS0354_027470 [Potamilus streckersoni]